MARNTKQTSPKIASDAAKVLRNPNSTAREKRVAGSALSQTKPKGKGQYS